MAGPGGAGRPIGFWLKLIDRLIDESFEATLGAEGVDRRQWQLLNVLADGPAGIEALDATVAPFVGAAEEPSSAPTAMELVARGWANQAGDGIEPAEESTIAVLTRMAANLGRRG